jgi:transposase InsO family protein
MTLHRNARTCPNSRRLIADRVLVEGWSLAAAAAAAGVRVPTARKWVRRFREQGEAGLDDRSSAPHRIPHRTPPERERAILSLRGLRLTAEQIAAALGMAPSTVSLVLKRTGQGRLPRLEAGEPERRYQRARPGELVHIDIKKLGRIARPGHRVTGSRKAKGYHRGRFEQGWEYVHVCVDDATRLAHVEVLGDERPSTCIGFLRRAIDHLASYGIEVRRVMTDNGNAYRSAAHALACQELGVRHLRTEPYTPRTNGKAERFIQTLVNGWAYAAVYGSSSERTAALQTWLHTYNHHRPHRSLGRKPPATRLAELHNEARAHS